MIFLYIMTIALAAALLFAVVRIDRLTRAAKHHEHVLRLTLETLSSQSCPQPLAAHHFALMVLNEDPWDARTRFLGSPLVAATPEPSAANSRKDSEGNET